MRHCEARRIRFVAFAPVFYRGKVADNIADAKGLGKALDANHLLARAEVAAVTLLLNEHAGPGDRGLAVIGFSRGACYTRKPSRRANAAI
jgi:hypothetical protein